MRMNEEEKRLIKIQTGFFESIKNFFKKLLFKFQVQNTKNAVERDNQFKENIEKKQDEKRILELQKEFKKGNIEEKNISDDDYAKLIKLYDEQNAKLRQEIEMYRIETAKILKQMNND